MRSLPVFVAMALSAACFCGWPSPVRGEATAVGKESPDADSPVKGAEEKRPEKIVKSDVEWRKQLSRMQYYVTRQGGTERAFTGRYWRHKVKGTYTCICCGEPLFSSSTKFRSGTGWPSFYAPIDKEQIEERLDRSLFTVRTEVRCRRCDAHLGHVFSDGPRPTGLRYCINSAALGFEVEKKKAEKKEEETAEDTAEVLRKPEE